jgi:hypothetical protein
MFTVVTTIFQQIMTKLSGSESEEDRIVVITKTVITHEAELTYTADYEREK